MSIHALVQILANVIQKDRNIYSVRKNEIRKRRKNKFERKKKTERKKETRPDTQSRAGGQGPYMRSLVHQGRRSEVKE